MMNDELICNGVSLELSEGIAVPLNFSIADVKDIKNRARKFSKEIKLEGTATNCAFFRSVYNFTVTDGAVNFDATQKTEAILKRRGIKAFGDGVLKLNKVEIIDGAITFFVHLFSDTVEDFLLLSGIRVSELDWSEYDHVLNRTNIKNSWTAPIGSGYYYPLIERGNGRVGTIWNTTDIVPYVYCKEVIEKMYSFLGLTVDPAWLNTTNVKNLLFGYGGGDYIDNSITPLDIADRLVDLTNGDLNYSDTQNVFWGTAIVNGTWTPALTSNIASFGSAELTGNDITFTTTSDNLLQYDSGVITVQKSGNYNLSLTGVLDFLYDTGILSFEFSTNSQLQIVRNGLAVKVQILNGDATNSYNRSVSLTTNLLCQSGDEITLRLLTGGCQVSRLVDTDTDTVNLDITTSTPFDLELTSIDENITDGGTVSLSKFIPDMLCSDFLVGFIRQFNLYTSDPSLDGVVEMLPFTQYYSDTSTFDDISEEIDYKKKVEVLPIANEYGKRFTFKYKTNKDRDNIVYSEKWGDNYGDYTYNQGSFFAKGEEKIQLPWSNIIPYEIDNGFLIPRYISEDNSGSIKGNKGEARICFRNGLKAGNWTFRNTDDPTQWEALTEYPCIHHFNDFEDPTFDLNFQLVAEVFYSTNIVTTVNCFVEYYSIFTNELTNRAGQIVKLYAKWSTQQVKDKDFSRLQMIDGALFRLNKIVDFDEDAQATTKIELVKVLEAKKRRAIQIVDDKASANTFLDFVSSPDGVGDDTPFVSGGINSVLLNTTFTIG